MKNQYVQAVRRILISGVVVAVAGVFSPMTQAGELTKDEMVKALQKKGKTRSIVPSQSQKGAREVQRVVRSLGGRVSREIVVEARKQISKAVVDNKLPTIDLAVPFEYDSSAISPKAMPVLVKLGEVLNDASLQGSTFLVGGHTDARGSYEYNIRLSQQRAQAVRKFLTETFGIGNDRLIAVGFGEIQLKIAAEPESGENRRVQLVNVSE